MCLNVLNEKHTELSGSYFLIKAALRRAFVKYVFDFLDFSKYMSQNITLLFQSHVKFEKKKILLS